MKGFRGLLFPGRAAQMQFPQAGNGQATKDDTRRYSEGELSKIWDCWVATQRRRLSANTDKCCDSLVVDNIHFPTQRTSNGKTLQLN